MGAGAGAGAGADAPAKHDEHEGGSFHAVGLSDGGCMMQRPQQPAPPRLSPDHPFRRRWTLTPEQSRSSRVTGAAVAAVAAAVAAAAVAAAAAAAVVAATAAGVAAAAAVAVAAAQKSPTSVTACWEIRFSGCHPERSRPLESRLHQP